jgi:hypothetical protein
MPRFVELSETEDKDIAEVTGLSSLRLGEMGWMIDEDRCLLFHMVTKVGNEHHFGSSQEKDCDVMKDDTRCKNSRFLDEVRPCTSE